MLVPETPGKKLCLRIRQFIVGLTNMLSLLYTGLWEVNTAVCTL